MIKILNIVGKSGTGKTTIAEAICKNPQFNFNHILTDQKGIEMKLAICLSMMQLYVV